MDENQARNESALSSGTDFLPPPVTLSDEEPIAMGGW
jgi:hypothetical protein